MLERRNDLMRTDLKETGEAYILEMDLPGCPKEKITAYVENEYLTVEADFRREETAKVRSRERYNGRCQRRFYVGEIRTEDVQAGYKDGVLTLTIPKKAYERVEEERRIMIE